MIVLGAGLILFYLATRFDARLMAHSLASGHDRIVAEILVDTFVLVMWIGCLFAVAVGTVVLIRPSYLKHFEARANQWLSTRQAAKGMNREVLDVDSLFERYPRLSGVVIALGSLVGLVGLLMLWGRF